MYIIYTDGSCLRNPGPGGFCAIIISSNGTQTEFVGSERRTTNNRMELMAAIRGLEEFDGPAEIEIRSDSEYLTKGMTDWIARWKADQWKTAKRKPVQNEDLWRQLDALVYGHRITWVHVRGHAGEPMNERTDQLARAAAENIAANRGGAAAE